MAAASRPDRGPDADCVAAAVDRAARAVLGVAGAAAGDRARERGEAAQHPPRRVGAGSRVPARRHRRVARAARGARRVESVLDAAGVRARWSISIAWAWSTRDLLAVHGVQFTDAELSRLAAAGATVVTCPRSNRWTGAGDAARRSLLCVRRPRRGRHRQPGQRRRPEPVRGAGGGAAPGARRARGRGSSKAPRSPAPRRSASPSELGSIEPGKRAQLLAVRLPAGVSDVEEYLLSGIDPSDVRGSTPEPLKARSGSWTRT